MCLDTAKPEPLLSIRMPRAAQLSGATHYRAIVYPDRENSARGSRRPWIESPILRGIRVSAAILISKNRRDHWRPAEPAADRPDRASSGLSNS